MSDWKRQKALAAYKVFAGYNIRTMTTEPGTRSGSVGMQKVRYKRGKRAKKARLV